MSALLCVGLALGSVGAVNSYREALEAIEANGPNRKGAVAYLDAKGKKGMWALNGAAKKADGAAQVRLYAALGELRAEGAEWALRTAWEAEDSDAKKGALLGLGQLGGALAERTLLEALRGDPAYWPAAAEGAARQVDRLRPELADLIRSPANRAAGLRVALAAGDPALTSTALALGLSDSRPEVQVLALRLAAQAQRTGTMDAVAAQLDSPHPEVAKAAVQAVSAIGGRDADDRLAATIGRGDAPAEVDALVFDRLRAARAWDPLFMALARRPDGPAFTARRLRLAEVDRDEAAAWVDGLDRASIRERRIASAAVEAFGSRIRPALIAALGAPSAAMRRRALEELQRGEDPDTVKRELEAALANEEAPVRAGAAGALIELEGLPEARARVVLLDDDAPPVRRAAARGLALLPSESLEAELMGRLPELTVEAQRGLLEGAAAREDDGFAERLARQLLDASDPAVRRLALEALHPARTEPTLRQLVEHVRTAPLDEKILAMEAIGASPLPRAGDLLVRLVTDVDPEVRKAALAYVDRL
jgi:HEAT repeat protein